MEKLILKHALTNAIEFGGKANPKAVLGKVIAERPELKKDINKLKLEVEKIVSEINHWPIDKQKAELAKLGPIIKPKKKKKHELPELPKAKKGKVIMRMAPNPNGPMHIGHARMAILNDEYVRRYKGKLILRFDDTDPKNPNKIPMAEAYEWFERDLKWLGVKYHKVFRASERLKTYYACFKKFLEKGIAYVCTCKQNYWSKLVRLTRKPCPCRANTVEENLERWQKMLIGEYKEGQAVGRIKTSLQLKDPAAIDWVAFRIVDKPVHPFVKDVYVWPMLDFASAIDDHDFKVTHILRGKDLMISEVRQKLLYEKIGWSYPVTRLYGKFIADKGIVISKSKVLEGIHKGLYIGWDDPRLFFICALRRRGIQPKAIRKYILSLGISEAETTVDLKILYKINKEIIDPRSNRYFIVSDPIQIELNKVPFKVVKAPLYPGKRKYRKIPVSRRIFIEKMDFVAHRGKEVRLMHLANYILERSAKYTSKSVKKIPKIHWVGQKNVKVKIMWEDARVIDCLAEPEIKSVKVDQTIQAERLGFMRVDAITPRIILYFAHR